MSEPWILLRGLTRESRHWGAFAALLDAREGVLPIDLPGNGTEAHNRSPLAVDAYVDALRAEAQRRGARAPYRVLAMSLGGMVATSWALRYPEEIERLVLVNTSMRPYSHVHERLRPSAWPALLRVARHWDGRDAQGVAETLIHSVTCARRDTLAADREPRECVAPTGRRRALHGARRAALRRARGVVAWRPAGESRLLGAARAGVGCSDGAASVGGPRPAARRPAMAGRSPAQTRRRTRLNRPRAARIVRPAIAP
jgi:pimeloyl-ACP methyl ester carboxylesterase